MKIVCVIVLVAVAHLVGFACRAVRRQERRCAKKDCAKKDCSSKEHLKQ
jgi:hypothetical protein